MSDIQEENKKLKEKIEHLLIDLHGHYEYVDMQGNRGISQHCVKYDYKKYGLECDTENGIQQVQAFKYIRD